MQVPELARAAPPLDTLLLLLPNVPDLVCILLLLLGQIRRRHRDGNFPCCTVAAAASRTTIVPATCSRTAFQVEAKGWFWARSNNWTGCPTPETVLVDSLRKYEKHPSLPEIGWVVRDG